MEQKNRLLHFRFWFSLSVWECVECVKNEKFRRRLGADTSASATTAGGASHDGTDSQPLRFTAGPAFTLTPRDAKSRVIPYRLLKSHRSTLKSHY